MARARFNFNDIEQECQIQYASHQLDGKALGIRILVPSEIQSSPIFSGSVYGFLQQLREPIFEYGTIEFPDLAFNKTNYTLAQKAPWQHLYSTNHYLTDFCQHPHQDTPPYPTAFGLEQPRKYFATWLMSVKGVNHYYEQQRARSGVSADELHKALVNKSLANGTGILVNQQPGLILIDNSNHRNLYHARTACFDLLEQHQPSQAEQDVPMYAFNEVGLMNYIDQLDSRRGQAYRDAKDAGEVARYMDRFGAK